MWKNGEIGENVHRDNVISSMNSHDIHYLERVEKRARDEFLNQPIKVENTFDRNEELCRYDFCLTVVVDIGQTKSYTWSILTS